MPTLKHFSLFVLMVFTLAQCGGGGDAEKSSAETSAHQAGGLTSWQQEHGIGPITESMVLGPVDQSLADSGKAVFDVKCVACHKIEARLVGPPLEDVTKRRSPEFIMNMILNPDQMVKEHPVVKELLGTYYVPMTFQNVSHEQAREILEYLRTQETDS